MGTADDWMELLSKLAPGTGTSVASTEVYDHSFYGPVWNASKDGSLTLPAFWQSVCHRFW
jgi:hypothetical protein